MSAICENFVQNAWRKDLCSNCFKLKQDHHVCSKSVDTFNQETNVYHSNSDKVQASTTWKGLAIQKNFIQNGYIINGLSSEHEHTSIQKCNGFLEKFQVIPTSILKNGHRKSSTGSVGFREEDPQVIGYGGEFEAVSGEESEDEESDQFEDCDSLENFDATEEDKEFMILTEKNTEFNSFHCNLLAPSTEEKTATVAKYNCEEGSSEKEVISKPVDDEQSGGNRFHLPRAAVRPFCRDSVASILDAKATTPAPEVHYDEDGHIVINEMNSRIVEEREVVAYEVSPVSKIAPENIESMFSSSDLPPELPSSPPPDELEQPLANSKYIKVNNSNESYYCSTAVVFSAVSDTECVSVDQGLEKPVKIKPIVPAKPKSRTTECCGLNSDSDSSSSPSSEEIYQDTRDVFQDSDDMKELSFKDKIANLHNNLDFNRKSTKRQAPQPPQSTGIEESIPEDPTNTNIPIAVIMRNLPAKRINSSSSDVEEQDQHQVNGLSYTPIAKPTSPPITRKVTYAGNAKLRTCHSLDVSSTRILSTPISEDGNKKLKGKFSLKKLLKFGKDGEDNTKNKSSSPYSGTTLEKKMKLEILHPMDLANLSPSNPTTPNGDWDPILTGEAGTFTYLNEDKIMSSTPGSPKSPAVVTRVKPPPPPRIKNETGAQNKPSRPPPPFKGLNDSSTTVLTSPDIKERNKTETNDVDLMPCAGGEYANLGEVRVIIAPKKPERYSPASVRKEQKEDLVEAIEDERKTEFPREHFYCEPPDSLVNSIAEDEISETSTLKASSPTIVKVSRHSRNAKAVGMVFPDSGFAEVSSTDSDAGSVSSGEGQLSSSRKVELSNLYAEVKKKEKNTKLRQMIPKNGSDDIAPPVPPPSSHRSESLSTDCDENGSSPEPVAKKCYNGKWKKCASLRANCSGIRGNLEENYNALVTANHEALAKIVEQISAQKNLSCFAGLQDTSLRWVDFKVGPMALAKLEHTAFYSAIWGSNTQVMLLVSEDIFPIPFPAKAPFLLSPIATFQDFIPLDFDFESEVSETKLHHRMIWVFPPVKVQSIENFCAKLKTLAEEDIENYTNLVTFLLLQLISALKHLQADGIEEVGYPPHWVVLMGNEDEDCTNLCLNLIGSSTQSFPHPDSDCYSLCACALLIMRLFLTGDANSDMKDICQVIRDNIVARTTFRVVIGILENERVTSLSQVKAILEFALYGPTVNQKHNEIGLQRWLDLEKAFALSNLISCINKGELTVFHDFHLRFLTRTNSRSLREAFSALTCSKA
uniref:Uncharacterized protein n=1 Tax=Strigamia maritima TaxID=126957 RepID=T1IZF0_STRMM